jgi:hypothetical protein
LSLIALRAAALEVDADLPLSNAEIADRLYLVEGTVKAYVSAVLTRL